MNAAALQVCSELQTALFPALEQVVGVEEDLSKCQGAVTVGLTDARNELLVSSQIESKQAFIQKYSIQTRGDSRAAIILPEGMSRIEFLKEAQALSQELYQQNPVDPGKIELWENDEKYNQQLSGPYTIIADVRIANSNSHTEDEMVSNGWLDLDIQDLVVAYAVLFVVKGENPFGNHVVQAHEGGLMYYKDRGLSTRDWFQYEVEGNPRVSASRSLNSLED